MRQFLNRYLQTLALAITLALGHAIPAIAQTIDQIVSDAENTAKFNPNAARKKFEEALKRDPKAWRANFGLGRIAYAQGNYREGLTQTQKAIKLHPSDVTMNLGVALNQEGLGNYSAAVDEYNLIISKLDKADPLFQDAVFARGQVVLRLALLSLGAKTTAASLDAAEKDFSNFIAADGQPQYFAWYHLACISAARGNGSLAADQIRLAWTALSSDLASDNSVPTAVLQSLLTKDPPKKVGRPGDALPCAPLKALIAKSLPFQTMP